MRSIVLSTGEFPSSLILRDVSRLSLYPILGGGFADIWQGKLSDGSIAALKVLRLFKNTEEEKTRTNKVCTADKLTSSYILISMNEGISFRGYNMVTASTSKHITVSWGMHYFI